MAIKVVAPQRVRERAYVDSFLREVRAAASLSHPSIVAVWDYGAVKPEEALASQEQFGAGSPWFAMELANLGSLEDLRNIGSWSGFKRVVVEILDALAHAHARGLIHRDLKPANILLTRRDGELRLLLADFGIAHALNSESLRERTRDVQAPSAGTPMYMAPEQIRAQWRDWGPWTDLYAVGCIAWELATGRPPFVGGNPLEVAMKHLTDGLPVFEPRFDMPPELESWMARLLQRDWSRRYLRAADAAWALLRMSDVEETDDVDPFDLGESSEAGERAVSDSLVTQIFDSHGVGGLMTLDGLIARTQMIPSVRMRAIRLEDSGARTDLRIIDVPPLPRDWRRSHRESRQKLRSGLGLFGVREVPLVDRNAERDVAWNALHDAVDLRAPRVLVLRGPSGSGKSKLIEWIATRGHEVGATHTFRAFHASIAGLGDGIPRMVSRYFECGGLTRSEAFDRLKGRLAAGAPESDVEHDAAALTELILPANPEVPDDVPPIRFGSPGERYAAVERVMTAAARHRAIIMTADDVQWGYDLLGFVEHLLEHVEVGTFPALIVLGVRPEELARRPLERRRFESLCARDEVQVLDLGPLPAEESRRLIDEWLGLDPDLADQLVTASKGDPVFSANVIADWVQREALIPGVGGYRFKEDTDFEIPLDVLEVCEARVARIAARFAVPSAVLRALEVAAALGETIDPGEWHAVGDRLNIRIPEGLTGALIEVGIARGSSESWSFVHGAMRQSLENSARESGRWEEIHAACGAANFRMMQNGSCPHERRARHFLEASRIVDSLRELAIAIEGRLVQSAYPEAETLADMYLQVAGASGIDLASDEVVRVLAMKGDAHRFVNDLDAAASCARRILTIADQTGSPLARAEGLRVTAGLEHRRGDLETGVHRYTSAIEWFERASDKLGIARCAHGRGWLNLNLSRFDRALEDFRLSTRLCRELAARRDLAWALQGLAEASLKVGDLEQGERAGEEALDLFRTLGSRSGEGMTLTTIGSLRAAAGDDEEARNWYRAAVNILAALDSPLLAFPLLHSVRVEVLRGDAESAAQILRLATAPVISRMPGPFRLAHRIGEVYVAAASGDANEAARALDALFTERSKYSGTLHPDLPPLLPVVRSRLSAIDPELAVRFDGILGGA